MGSSFLPMHLQAACEQVAVSLSNPTRHMTAATLLAVGRCQRQGHPSESGTCQTLAIMQPLLQQSRACVARLLLRVMAANEMLSASSSAATASLVGAKKVPARTPDCIAPYSADACA